MSPIALTFLTMAPLAVAADQKADHAALGDRVAAIMRADYSGEREDLRRLAAELERVKSPDLAPFREYWIGFALWRRALNGFNVGAPTAEERADLEAAVAAFKRALELKPGWLEPKVGIAGSVASLLYLAQQAQDEPRRQALLDEYRPTFRSMREEGLENPRALWIVGGVENGAPPPVGGHPEQAAATHLRALDAARKEALARVDAPAWLPAWGGPENLMSLAYLHSQGVLTNRPLALAYAQGALVSVPHWRFLKDVLLPRIEALPAAP
jgi:hypothetical protein